MLKWIIPAAFFVSVAFAQMPGPMPGPRPGGEMCRPGRQVPELKLSEAQQTQIASICKDSSKKIFDLRETWRKAETDLQAAFDESSVDQTKSNAAIERLVSARADLFRATSQMDLKIRTVLTDEQWQELKKHQRRGLSGRGGPDWRRGGPKGPTSTGQPQTKN